MIVDGSFLFICYLIYGMVIINEKYQEKFDNEMVGVAMSLMVQKVIL